MPMTTGPLDTERRAVRDAAREILQRHDDPDSAWSALQRNGFTDLSADDAGHACEVIRATAAVAREPLALMTSTLVAPWLRAALQLPAVPGPIALCGPGGLTVDAGRLGGTARGVVFAEQARCLLITAEVASDWVVLVQLDVRSHPELQVRPTSGRRGIPLADIVCPTPIDLAPDQLRPLPPPVRLGLELVRAAGVTCQLAGVLAGVAEMTVRYARERRQFGRPIADFQMVKSHLAELVAEAAAAGAAADGAARALHDPLANELILRAARVRSAEAATVAARLAHQVHATMGVTEEYPLHTLTKQLWFWRDHAGAQHVHERRLGALVTRIGGETLWERIVGEHGTASTRPRDR